MRRKDYLVLLCGAVLLLSLVYFACGSDQTRRPSRYLIPEGYVGHVPIEFKIKERPPLPIEDGYFLFVIPSTGTLQTSSGLEYGWAKDEYYYYSSSDRRELKETGWGYGGMIWGGGNGYDCGEVKSCSVGQVLYQGFFVGTEAQYRESFQSIESGNSKN